MTGNRDGLSDAKDGDGAAESSTCKASDRRSFLGRAGSLAATLAAGAFAGPAVASAQTADGIDGGVATPSCVTNQRVREAFQLRVGMAMQDASVPAAINLNNGDDARYPDKGGTFTKGLPHDNFGRVELTAYESFKTALTSGRFSDFEKIIMGGTRTLNGPQAGLAFDLCAMDSAQFGQPEVPPAPLIAGDQSATELLEHYWASLLRDVAFTEYGSNALAGMAAAELSGLSSYLGPRNSHGQVTNGLLFRGVFPGETQGPYISQFFITPTSLGAQPVTQQMVSYLPGFDYMTSFNDWLTVQNGNFTGLENQIDPVLRYRRMGRDLAAFTHMDVLYQAHFVAFLVLSNMGAPLNPGNPYIASRCENGFGTFGAPDFAVSLAEVATKALNAVWYQKWFVHLRPRPEAAGGLVHLVKSGQGNKTDVVPSEVILNSRGTSTELQQARDVAAFAGVSGRLADAPGLPDWARHRCGGVITVLKFFFDGNYVIPNPVAPAAMGLSLVPYTGPGCRTAYREW